MATYGVHEWEVETQDSFEKFLWTVRYFFPQCKTHHWDPMKWIKAGCCCLRRKLFTGSYKPTGDKCLILNRFWVEYPFKFYCLLKQHSWHCVAEQLTVLSLTSAATKYDAVIEFYTLWNLEEIKAPYQTGDEVGGWHTSCPDSFDSWVLKMASGSYKWLKLPEVSWSSHNRQVRL